MEIRHIMHTARSATIEIADGGRYFTKQPVELRVNGEPSLTTEKTITSLFSLKPDQKYVVEAYVNGEKQGEVSFKIFRSYCLYILISNKVLDKLRFIYTKDIHLR